jgi:RNA polymerase-binding protein DksA
MPTTSHSRQIRRTPLAHDPGRACTESAALRQRMKLWAELTRQRALLLADAHLSLVADGEPEMHPDPVDQASTEFGQDLAIQVRVRTFDKLRHIEHALRLMHTNDYGRCRRCHKDIPFERLMVKPDALFCVPCLTLIEHGAARN